MTADEAPAGAKVTVSVEELRDGADQLHDLAGETASKLASSDQMLDTSSQAWKGLKSAAAYAAYAEHETARGTAAVASLADAAGNVAHAAEHYERTDGASADAIDRIV
ncbi:hypothetical protein Srot_1219 [Segniliparus rotundus DSM 44985]|uniref:Uncharacterized protein n=1 Tax=Segniliparus rotundus (strain ATCC BAA-972 / CDC 1076 / CIP 108378 / DSM 44985 / JCM 13578) TaxID=640132 RepID=D6ZFG6_SEGRD|nr:type VII secretion target [Segniliparus rotundus]ADG97690.1 hypothetical protein Srot_1219 [Segniliparus rotundus DSM 44985]